MIFRKAQEDRWSPLALGLVVMLHGAGVYALMNQPVAVELPIEQPILVSLVLPEPAPEIITPPPRPEVKPVPKPKPIVKRELPKPRPLPKIEEPVPLLKAEAPAEMPAPSVREPEPLPDPAPDVTPVKPEPEIAKAPPKPVLPQEAPIEAPRFNADYLDNPHPTYPRLSRRLGEEGRVLLRVQVDVNGTPAQVVLYQSSGHARLDEVAASTVQHWKFVPARQGGKPVAAWVIVPIQFSLRG